MSACGKSFCISWGFIKELVLAAVVPKLRSGVDKGPDSGLGFYVSPALMIGDPGLEPCTMQEAVDGEIAKFCGIDGVTAASSDIRCGLIKRMR